MKILEINHVSGDKLKVAVQSDDVLAFAYILENSNSVKTFHVSGLNVPNQRNYYACRAEDFEKWISPIQQ